MNHPFVLSAFLLLAGVATAQVTLQPSLVHPHTTAAMVGSTTSSATSPFPQDVITAGIPGEITTYLQCGSIQMPGQLYYATTHQVGIGAATPSPVLGVCDVDVRLGLVAQAPTSVRIAVEASFFAPPGTPQPTVRVDLDDNGSAEFTGIATQTFFSLLPAGTMTIRFTAFTTATLPGNTTLNLAVRVVPAHTTFVPQVAGCDPVGDDTLAALPEFDGTVSFSAVPFLGDPVILVLGLAPSPLVLPSIGGVPCILWPSPDVLVLMPTLGGAQPFYSQPLPPAVRPISFYAQAVRLTATELQATNALRLDAN